MKALQKLFAFNISNVCYLLCAIATLTVVGFLYNFGDRWLLQSFGGSIEQAFYAVAFQFGSLILLFTTSILHIFWKEIAEAHHRNDATLVKVIAAVFSHSVFISSLSAGFLIPWAEDILTVSVGTAYSGGVATLMVMLLFLYKSGWSNFWVQHP